MSYILKNLKQAEEAMGEVGIGGFFVSSIQADREIEDNPAANDLSGSQPAGKTNQEKEDSGNSSFGNNNVLLFSKFQPNSSSRLKIPESST